MASFVPPLLDPENPDAVAEWARAVADWANGQVSIGEPVATIGDGSGIVDPLRPNGVKGHLLGSFVVRSDIVLADTVYTFTHNLNIPNKAVANDPLNVCWVVVRLVHDGTAVNEASTISVNYESGDAVTENAIDLRFYIGGARTIAAPNPLTAALWFFPTTR